MIQSTVINRRRQVLVVEDQELNRDIPGMILEDDYEVLTAEKQAELKALQLGAAEFEKLIVREIEAAKERQS